MMRLRLPALLAATALLLLTSCKGSEKAAPAAALPFTWNNANIYFLLTDRFLNGDPSNDLNFDRSLPTAPMRGYMGGDLQGVIEKMEEGYFEQLGITALWLTPWFEQNRGIVDEGTGPTYAYHGYWAQDWTCLDPNVGTEEELAQLIALAHKKGIRIVMDVVVNHTGPVTEKDPAWPENWVRTGPPCAFDSYDNTVHCTLVENLPDVRTGAQEEVELPPALLAKWEKEGRLDKEVAELDAFFERTGYPRTPRYHIIKWLTDYVRKYGIDGYRLDTAKHTEEDVWSDLHGEAVIAFQEWKEQHPESILDDLDFYMVGEVYGYGIHGERYFDFGDRKVDFFAQDIHSMINFAFIGDANNSYEDLFSSYARYLHGPLKGHGVVNYLSSHDDHHPYDPLRERSLEAGTRLLLAPGSSQVYYGDESGRILQVDGAAGDAHLRSPMNWDDFDMQVYEHYCKLGQFRKDNPAVGAGVHRMLNEKPYVFARSYASGEQENQVVAALDLEAGHKVLEVASVFGDGTLLLDYYSGREVRVRNGKVELESPWNLVLLAAK